MTIEVGKFIGSGAALRLAGVKLENHSVLLFLFGGHHAPFENGQGSEVLDRCSTCAWSAIDDFSHCIDDIDL